MEFYPIVASGIYMAVGLLMGVVVALAPARHDGLTVKQRLSLFGLLLFAWFPLSVIAFFLGPFLHVCLNDMQ